MNRERFNIIVTLLSVIIGLLNKIGQLIISRSYNNMEQEHYDQQFNDKRIEALDVLKKASKYLD